ncbi:hypothetical protein ES332_D13G100500v1 [Gossypium tomentosum]|uniref:Uncharacterized protein n=1 Tax=Gossypium tomentosum TaxID=34277 RepID=A0A5D2HV55_GOSTO|nr:hypothetical protein ES332_D13G100500v1 [Gossypium tomentosum]
MRLKRLISERKSFDDLHGVQDRVSPRHKAANCYPLLCVPLNPVLSHNLIHHIWVFFNPVHSLLVPTTFTRKCMRRCASFPTNKTESNPVKVPLIIFNILNLRTDLSSSLE